MRTIIFERLIDSRTGKPVEIEVPDDFNESGMKAAAEAGRREAEEIDKMFGRAAKAVSRTRLLNERS